MLPNAVVAGHLCFDIIPSFSSLEPMELNELFKPGKLINMNGASVSTGGPVSNTGLALSKLGIETALMGKVSDDFFGDCVKTLFAQNGISRGLITSPGEQTSYTVVIVPPGYDRIFLHNPGANDSFCAADVDYQTVASAALFHFGYPPLMKRMFAETGAELIRMFKQVKELGVTTSLDMSLPDEQSESGQVDWDTLLRGLLPYVDIYIPSAEETLYMLDREKYHELNRISGGRDPMELFDVDWLPALGERLLAYGCGMAVIKCGCKGYYIRTSGRERLETMKKAPPGELSSWAGRELMEESFFASEIASAAGAGDNSIAGFISAFLRGQSIEDCIRFGCAVGRLNLEVYDAVTGVRSYDETRALIPGWRKNELAYTGSYWRKDSSPGNWIGKADSM